MIEAALEGLRGILEPWALFLMVSGVVASSIVAALPGIGSLLLLTIVLPYSFTLTAYQAIALLLGIGAVSNTANTFPSVLLAVPGSAGSQATIVDGYPMAQKGEARRAFGAAFAASAAGGIFGALVLFVSLPVLRPLVLSFGSPEFFVLIVWGLSTVAVLSGKAPVKGLLAAIIGLLISSIGIDEKTAIERFAFGGTYLWGGIDIVILGLGVFAVPELIDLAIRRNSIAQSESLGAGVWQGIQDVFRNWWLVIRCSAIGVWVGVLPGLGSSVADWFAYAHAVQTEKNADSFGKGDVRGVIAPESSNNAKEGGALIPTLAFGIPGSVSLAIMLVAFIGVGIRPGSAMLTEQLNLTLAMVWVLVLSNLLATAIALCFSNAFARISFLPFYNIVPVTLVLCVLASFAANYSWPDLIVFSLTSVLGYLMKSFGWPRPPLLVAAVLGKQMETYLWLSIARYGMMWLVHPGVLLLFLVVVSTLVVSVIRLWREKRQKKEADDAQINGSAGDAFLTATFILILCGAAYLAQAWPLRGAFIVDVIAGVGVPLGVIQIVADVRNARASSPTPSLRQRLAADLTRRKIEILAWFVGLIASLFLVGFHITLPLFSILYAKRYAATWKNAIVLGGFAILATVGIFDEILHVIWPETVLTMIWPS